MKDMLWLIRNTLTVTFRKKRNLFFYLILPLISIVIAFIAYGDNDSQHLTVGIVDHDQEPITRQTIQFIKNLDHVDIELLNKKAVKQAITSGKVDEVITFDSGYAASILAQHPNHIRLTSIKGESVTQLLKTYLYAYIDNLTEISGAANGDPVQFAKIAKAYTHHQADFPLKTAKIRDNAADQNVTYTAIGFLIMIMMISAVSLAEIILKEKEERTYFRLLSTPITAKSYILSNTIVNLLIMIVQFLLTLTILSLIFDINLGIPIWKASIVMLLFSLISVGLSLVIVSFSGSRNSVNALSNLVIMPTVMLSGCFWPVEIMPKMAQKIAEFLPQRWTLDTLTALQEGKTIPSLYLNFAILITFALTFFLIAVYRFNKNNSTKKFI